MGRSSPDTPRPFTHHARTRTLHLAPMQTQAPALLRPFHVPPPCVRRHHHTMTTTNCASSSTSASSSTCAPRSYVEQVDVHNPEATVEEALAFSARLRVGSAALMNPRDGSGLHGAAALKAYLAAMMEVRRRIGATCPVADNSYDRSIAHGVAL